jgi:hypothetical protein
MRNGVHLQRRHFELIAEIIAKELEGEAKEQVAKAFANQLKRTNAQFKRDRFIAACHVEVEQ